ncbi:hypothetical protein RM780_14385 [Streptomyces sp. DSM 44917]|uniref:Prevent-host-death family protein n=1 Tax=Streptomyces boetiae TaxID=3075541 RepID=A0ABU2L9G5_9ACTN|nr:hypothetical protein [Streptomyces sp. DSM 44917]MDT0308142.1 hypothetical protein [Streptomyces sp. DSM 44917]
MTTPSEELPFTEFIQRPTAATGRLSSVRALRLRRRDADDLVVMRAERADREGEVVDFTARLLVSLLHREGGAGLVESVLPEVLPWVRFLPDADIGVFAAELAEIAFAAAALGNTGPVAQLLVEWQHTAEVHADPELHAWLSRPSGQDYGPALPPEDGQ